MAIKNIAGQPVRGENFFNRPLLIQQLRRKIQSGSSILISAPRRVGKTSLMLHLHDTGMEGYYFIYLITESVNSENEYYKRILHKIFDTEFLTPMQKLSKKTFQTLKDRASRISEIGKTVKFDKESKLNYREEFIDMMKTIDLEGQKIILMIDEFSQTIENIIVDEGENSAKMIDRAFSRMLDLRNCFEHWHTRLRKAFKRENYSFAKELLNVVSQKENINTEEIFNLAQKFGIVDGGEGVSQKKCSLLNTRYSRIPNSRATNLAIF